MIMRRYGVQLEEESLAALRLEEEERKRHRELVNTNLYVPVECLSHLTQGRRTACECAEAADG